jgi:Na+/proline symporter
MLQGWVIVLASFLYLGVLFAIAWYADHRSDHGRSLIASPLVYALSLGVYCTTWTFYGSVGRAAANGIGFLPIYLGPTLLFALGGFILYRMIRIAKANRITSIADFVASRYGKSQLLGGLVTVIAVVGVIPYIALQLKAVSNSFTILGNYPEIVMPAAVGAVPLFQDSALYVAMILAAFTILFGTRHLDATERHEGMVAAIAVESVVKLVAFLAVGAFVVWGMHDGVGDIFARAAAVPEVATRLDRADAPAAYGSWGTLIFLSLFASLLLPRQFQIAVVENVDATHLNRAVWLFPLYLFLINLFVLPVALAGLMHFPRHGGCRYLRADPADGPPAGDPGPVRVHRRPVGGHRHGDRRNHRLVDHGLQRPRHATAAAHALARAGGARPISPACCWRSGAGPSPSSSVWVTSTSASPAKPTRWSRSA